jgi:hypothetical protein
MKKKILDPRRKVIAGKAESLDIFDKHGQCNDPTLTRDKVELPDGHRDAMRATVYFDTREPQQYRGEVAPWCAPWLLSGIFSRA